jgi:hypothetical protein
MEGGPVSNHGFGDDVVRCLFGFQVWRATIGSRANRRWQRWIWCSSGDLARCDQESRGEPLVTAENGYELSHRGDEEGRVLAVEIEKRDGSKPG